jgi:hypothetical protein
MPEPELELDCFSKGCQDLCGKALSDEAVVNHLNELKTTDAQTYDHSVRVMRMMAEFAASGASELNGQAIEAVRAAALHDLGKVGIHNDILYKQGALGVTEWSSVEKHPVIGFLRTVSDLGVHESIPILRHHTLQTRDYPPANEQTGLMDSFEVQKSALDDEDIITSTIMIAVADNLDARYPANDEGIRSYARGERKYCIDELPKLVKASFVRAGKIRALGKEKLLDDLLTVGQDTFLRKK